MHGQAAGLPWDEPDWIAGVQSWVAARLSEKKIAINGPLEIIHQRRWSTFAKVPTEQGIVYFKAPAPLPWSAYEAPLTAALARWRPDCTVPVIAVDEERGWTLTADAGVTLRSMGQTPAQIEHWMALLPLYVELQMEMVDHVPELLAMGVPDRRLGQMPRLYNALLADRELLLIGLKDGLTPEEFQQLNDLRPRFAEQCAELAACGFADTLAHEEVHENNVIFGDGRYIFTDWMDSSVAHPFFSILVMLTTTNYWLNLEKDGPEHRRIRDAYLEPWTAWATRAQVTAAFELAYPLAMVNRALSWAAGTGSLPAEQKKEYADYVPGWLQEYLQAVTVG